MPDRADSTAAAQAPAHPAARTWDALGPGQRLLLWSIVGLCIGINYWVGRVLGWPMFPHHEASLLAAKTPGIAVATAVIAILVSLTVGTLLLGRLRYDAGLFAAAIGLATLAVRGGPVNDTLRTAGHPQLYRTLLIETLVLFAIVALAWALLALFARWQWLPPEAPELDDDDTPRRGTIPQFVLGALVQAVVTGLLVILLAQSDSKKQVMMAVAIGSILGGIAAHQSCPVCPSVPFWSGPFITAAVGYVWALKSPGRWAIGIPANALAAASPLDYASLGTAGAILGYWISRTWQQPPPEMEIGPDAVE
jgi:hypothetical protein